MNLYVIRHGQTDWNIKKRFQGHSDIPLNATGVKQAQAAKEQLKNIPFDLCITSPLQRAAQTAEIICSDRCPIIYNHLLVERNFGQLEGTIANQKIILSIWASDTAYQDPNFETLEQMVDRAQRFLQFLQTLTAKTVLVASHGGFLKALHFTITGHDEDTDFTSWRLDNCQTHHYQLHQS